MNTTNVFLAIVLAALLAAGMFGAYLDLGSPG
jgi:hypothetical protein